MNAAPTLARARITTPRAQVGWRDVWLGGLIAGLVWEAGKEISAWYVGSVANYNAIYGSVGAIIANETAPVRERKDCGVGNSGTGR